MKKWLLLLVVVMVFVVVSLSGCAGSGVPADYEQVKNTLTTIQADLTAAKADLTTTKADLTAAKADLTTTKADLTAAKAGLEATKNAVAGLAPQVASLSADSAYNIWYDQYYGVYNYQFADTATFRTEMSTLITAANDAATKTAWDAYIVSVKALDAIVASLPADSTKWNTDENNKWLTAYNASWADFGKVGTALYNAAHYSTSQIRIVDLENRVASLSLFSAYNIWYDQYTLLGTANQYYAFTDATSFNTRLGGLISATGDSASIAAWDTYLAADTALNDVVAELPEDYNTWTAEQTNRWSQASTARTNALGEVGTALFNAIKG